MPLGFGIFWYYAFYTPVMKKSGTRNAEEAWIAPTGSDPRWGGIAGGHCICGAGASDRREAFELANTWGRSYGKKGRIWVPYKAVERLMGEQGECAIVTDR
jgi:C1A family cysteine protease